MLPEFQPPENGVPGWQRKSKWGGDSRQLPEGGKTRIATFHIADHFFYVKKSVNLRKDDTKNHDTRTVLLLGVLGEIYKQPGAKSSLLCFETEKSWILCLRVRPGVGEPRLWRKQMGGAPPPKSVSLCFLCKSIFQKYENWHQPKAAFGVYGGGHRIVVGVVGKHSGNTFLEIIPYWPEPQLWQLLGIPLTMVDDTLAQIHLELHPRPSFISIFSSYPLSLAEWPNYSLINSWVYIF